MKEIPLSVIITWPIPNYTNPQIQGYGALIVNVIFMAITIPMVALRVYSRWSMRRWLGLDDLFCVLAIIFAIGLSISTIIANYVYGCDRHIYDIPPANLEAVLKIIMATKALFTCASTFIRQSLLCLYIRLISDSGMAKFKWAIHLATVLNVSIGIAFMCLTIFQCTPISAYWMYPSDKYGTCLDEGIVTLVCGIIITIVDFIVLLLPIPIIMRLQMSFRRKLGVIVLLNLGLIASIMAIVRTWYIWKATIGSYDESWYAYPLWMIAVIEIDLAIMASCAPAIRPLLAEHAPWLLVPFRKLSSVFNTCRSMRTSRRTSGYGPGPSRDYTNIKGSDHSNTQISTELEQPEVVSEKQTYAKSADMEWGDSHAHEKDVAIDSSRNRTRSLAPSEAPTLHPRPKSREGLGIGAIRNIFSSRKRRRSESATRPYVERSIYTHDDSVGDLHSADIRKRLSRSKSRRFEMIRARSSEGLQVYKQQSFEIDSAPALSPEELTALQYSLAGVPVNTPRHAAAVVQQSRPLAERRYTSGSLGHSRGSSNDTSRASRLMMYQDEPMPISPKARQASTSNAFAAGSELPQEDRGRTASIWDVKRREWELHGRQWPRMAERETLRAEHTPAQHGGQASTITARSTLPDHIVYQSRLVSDSEPVASAPAPQPAQVRRMRDRTSPHTLGSSIGSFLDDASAESVDRASNRHDRRVEGRGRRRSRGI